MAARGRGTGSLQPAEAWRFIVGQLRRWNKVDYFMSPRNEGPPESRKQALARLLEERIS